MKRKILITMLIISAVVLPLAARSSNVNPNYIGGYFGGDFSFQKLKDSDSDSVRITGITFGAEGANFVGKNGNFGLGYSIGGIIPTARTAGDFTQDLDDEPMLLDVSAVLFYRYPVSRKFSIAAGLGAGYGFVKNSESTSDRVKMTSTTNTVQILGDVKLMVNVIDSLKLFGGVRLGGAVYNKTTVKINNQSGTFDEETSIFRVTPYIGIGFAY